MKISPVHFLITTFLLAGSMQVLGQVSTPDHRLEVLEATRRFETVSLSDVTDVYPNALNPFAPKELGVSEGEGVVSEPEVVVPEVVLVDEKQLLREISKQVKPTGVLQMGSSFMLLFGERRVGAGDYVFLTHNDKDYQMQILTVNRTHFTLQLNQEVISKRIQ